eukprot:802048-Prymnesium_polylepis.1
MKSGEFPPREGRTPRHAGGCGPSLGETQKQSSPHGVMEVLRVNQGSAATGIALVNVCWPSESIKTICFPVYFGAQNLPQRRDYPFYPPFLPGCHSGEGGSAQTPRARAANIGLEGAPHRAGGDAREADRT